MVENETAGVGQWTQIKSKSKDRKQFFCLLKAAAILALIMSNSAYATIPYSPQPRAPSDAEFKMIQDCCAAGLRRHQGDMVIELSNHFLYRSRSDCKIGRRAEVCITYAVSNSSSECREPFYMGLKVVYLPVPIERLNDLRDQERRIPKEILDNNTFEFPRSILTYTGRALLMESPNNIFIFISE